MAYSQQVHDFQRRMAAIPQQLRDELLVILRKNAEELADAIRHLAKEHSVSGDLIASIKVTGPGESTPAFSLGGARVAGPLEFIVSVGNDVVRYAAHVEFGTVHAPAYPFFWPAVRSLKRRFDNRLNRQVRQFFKKWGGA